MRKRRAKQALAVMIFTGSIFLSGHFGNRMEAQEAAADLFEPDEVQAAAVSQSAQPPLIPDMTDSFAIILNGATGEFIGGHTVDQAFLLWLDAQYGDEVIMRLAAHVLDGAMEPEVWHELTGRSIHVLWLDYCKYTGFQSYQLENVRWQECKSEEEIIIRFAGDFNLAENWYTTDYMERQADGIYSCISEGLFAQMQEADLFLINNEFAFSTGGQALAGKDYVFRAKPEYIEILKSFGTDVVTLANNHVYDYGAEALCDTLDCFEKEEIASVGAGKNIEEASKILYYVANGRKIAFVSATEIERTTQYTKEATETEAGVLKMLDPEKFLQVIKEADQNSDYVIAFVHWGTEGAVKYDAVQYKLAEQMVFAGADAIIGAHPHRLEGAGFILEKPVAYSLGNFWFSTGTLYTTLAQLTIEADGSLQLSYLPCIQKGLTTSIITDEAEMARFYEYIAAVSVQVGIDGNGNVYDKTAENYPAAEILYDSDMIDTDILGSRDIEGNTIDIVGNLK